MDYDNIDLKTRLIKHYFLPSAALIYCLVGAIIGDIPMYSRSGTISLSASDALILALSPAFWLLSDLVMFEPIFKLPRVKRLVIGSLLLIPAGYVFYQVLMV